MLPALPDGSCVGLLGGSFNPPHAGHLHISKVALRRLRLDRLLWLLSPGNPLKTRQPAPLARRMAACDALIDHPAIRASALEIEMGTRYTVDTLELLRRRYPRVRFVWVMGADSLASFHRWKDWPRIFDLVPIAVVSRPGEHARAGVSPAAQRFARFRIPQPAAPMLAYMKPPCWTLMTHPTSPLSSTELRRRGGWP